MGDSRPAWAAESILAPLRGAAIGTSGKEPYTRALHISDHFVRWDTIRGRVRGLRKSKAVVKAGGGKDLGTYSAVAASVTHAIRRSECTKGKLAFGEVRTSKGLRL